MQTNTAKTASTTTTTKQTKMKILDFMSFRANWFHIQQFNYTHLACLSNDIFMRNSLTSREREAQSERSLSCTHIVFSLYISHSHSPIYAGHVHSPPEWNIPIRLKEKKTVLDCDVCARVCVWVSHWQIQISKICVNSNLCLCWNTYGRNGNRHRIHQRTHAYMCTWRMDMHERERAVPYEARKSHCMIHTHKLMYSKQFTWLYSISILWTESEMNECYGDVLNMDICTIHIQIYLGGIFKICRWFDR